MMSAADSDIENTLRKSFTHCFKALTGDVSEACQVQRVLEELTRVSRLILADLVDDWQQQHDLLLQMPNEIIASCFECLPFRDRVRATHVSRRWRMIALALPSLWADIDLTERFNDPTALLEMALVRAGRLPLVIRGCPEPVGPGTVGNSLKAHLSHIQYLELPSRVRLDQLTGPAPLLRFLHVQIACGIREDFLGGRVGQLQTLKLGNVMFPPTCPALSTVTNLTLHPRYDPHHIPTYRPLFRLFPALQSLSLLDLYFSDRTLVPDGPAPRSLRQLVLETSQMDFDTCECYEHWASVASNVAEVTIKQYTPPTRHLHHLVSGAVEIIIGSEDGFTQTLCNLIAVGPGDRRRTLSFWGISDDSDEVAQALLDVRASLTDVRAFDITSGSFVGLLAVLPALPDLAHLTVTYEFDGSQPPSCEGGTPLSLLSRCPAGLQSLTIRVERHGRPPMYAAAALFKELEALAHDNVKLPDLIVRGITTVDVLCMKIPRFDGFQVIFDSEMPQPASE